MKHILSLLAAIVLLGIATDKLHSQTYNRSTDSLALLSMMHSMNGARWEYYPDTVIPWQEYYPIDQWVGVTVGENNRVVKIDLSLNIKNVIGHLPDSIGLLTELTFLALGIAPNLTGNIPGSIGNLNHLRYLDLGATRITGHIPHELWTLSKLQYLYLGHQLNGHISDSIGLLKDLKAFSISGDVIVGPIPPIIGTLTNLEFLDLSGNFEGNLPEEIGNLTNLTFLYIASGTSTGSIPESFANLTKLKQFYLHSTHVGISGQVPFSLSAWKDLEEIQIVNSLVSDTIPSWLTGCPNLIRGYFVASNFTTLPDLSSISWQLLSVAYNKLTFEDLEPNRNIQRFTYSPQDSVDMQYDDAGINKTLAVQVGGSQNHYKWFKKDLVLPDTSTIILLKASDDPADYRCEITNPLLPLLTIYTKKKPSIFVGVKDVQRPEFTISLVKNPVSDMALVEFEVSGSDIAKISLYDVNGNRHTEMYHQCSQTGKQRITLDTHSLPAGSYTITVEYHDIVKTLALRVIR